MSDTIETKLSIMTWNVNGLGDQIKRGVVLQCLKRYSPDIILLQETHLMGNNCKALNCWGYKLLVHAGFTSGSRGTGILIRKNLTLIPKKTWADPQGRFAVLEAIWEGKPLNIISAYLPPALVKTAIPDLGKILTDLAEGTLILGGDFNMTMDESLDIHPPRQALP